VRIRGSSRLGPGDTRASYSESTSPLGCLRLEAKMPSPPMRGRTHSAEALDAEPSNQLHQSSPASPTSRSRSGRTAAIPEPSATTRARGRQLDGAEGAFPLFQVKHEVEFVGTVAEHRLLLDECVVEQVLPFLVESFERERSSDSALSRVEFVHLSGKLLEAAARSFSSE
jgi:hypothetical protein